MLAAVRFPNITKTIRGVGFSDSWAIKPTCVTIFCFLVSKFCESSSPVGWAIRKDVQSLRSVFLICDFQLISSTFWLAKRSFNFLWFLVDLIISNGYCGNQDIGRLMSCHIWSLNEAYGKSVKCKHILKTYLKVILKNCLGSSLLTSYIFCGGVFLADMMKMSLV